MEAVHWKASRGKTNYIIYGSQSDSKASIKIEKEEGVPRD